MFRRKRRFFLIGMGNFLKGDYEIVKLPFEPKQGETYYKVILRDGLSVAKEDWTGWLADYSDKYCGNCFRTESEAEKHKYEIYEKLAGKRWGE